MYDSVLEQFRSAGLLLDSFELDTTSIVRCKVEGDKGEKKSGWYRVYSVTSKAGNRYFVGSYGNWKNGALPEKGATIKYDQAGLSGEDKALFRKRQREAQKAADAERKAKQAQAAERGQCIWENLPEQGASEYLERKCVKGFGLRFSRGAIVLPVKRITGEMVGLQFIYGDGQKKFLTGTAKAGAFHSIGDLANSTNIVIAEGYATAASLFMATGFTSVVAFDAGNLEKVAALIKGEYPSAIIVIAADNDETGIKNAEKAANKTGALLCVPDFSGCDGASMSSVSDFNDLHILQGLDKVNDQIKNALSCHVDQLSSVAIDVSIPEVRGAYKVSGGYDVLDSGVYWSDPSGEDSGDLKKYRVSARLDVIAIARTSDRRDYGVMLSFKNLDGDSVEWFVPNRLFASEQGTKVIEGLLDRGFEIDPHRQSKKRLLDYLQRAKPKKLIALINKFGWVQGAYVSPLGVIGQPNESLHYYVERKLLNRAALSGSLRGWKENISRYCLGNPLMLFAVSVPFVGPMLEWLGMKTIGYHILGDSSLGKSTLSIIAGSVCGGSNYFRTWNTTAAALESTASEHSDSLLVLDEINQADPFTIGQTVYQIGNEEGRARATDTGGANRMQHKWRLVWLSNGERSLKELQTRVGKTTEAGMEMRLLHIRGDLHSNRAESQQKGIFQELHDFAHGSKLSDFLKQQVEQNHGHAFLEFTTWLTSLSEDQKKKLIARIQSNIQDFQHKNLSADASGQAMRAASGFAVVGECGELATKIGITGWPEGEARKAASTLFQNFIEDRGGEGNSEDRNVLERIVLELQTKGESHFTRWDRDEATIDTHQPRSVERWGFRKVESHTSYGEPEYSEEEFYIFKEAFRYKLCKDLNYKRACDLLKERNALITSKGKGYLYQKLLPGSGSKQTYVYCIRMSALQDLMADNAVDTQRKVG